MQGDALGSNSHFLTPRKSSPRPNMINSRRSNASLHPPTLAHTVDDDGPNGRHSLAHELAAALMPEPSAGSKLLAEEFGIEYDEGAEGIDKLHDDDAQFVRDDAHAPSFIDELASSSPFDSDPPPSELDNSPPQFDSLFRDPSPPKNHKKQKPQQDALEVLAQDLKSTDDFLANLRTLDIDPGVQPPGLERIASDVIRRINETARDREGQVRELLGYEREFRRIAAEVGGNDVLGLLDELVHIDDLSDDTPTQTDRPRYVPRRPLDTLEEEPSSPQHRSNSHDWEVDPDHLQDEDNEDIDSLSSPVKDSFPPPPPVNGHPTPAKTIPQLAHLRSFTTSLVASLTTISEQAQVNGAATTEAGRKIRALKNKLGGWRTEWDSAEKSRVRIDRWEAGIVDRGEDEGVMTLTIPTRIVTSKRVDGRRVVEEHLRAFELALADAAVKTQAIMAS